MLFLSRYLSIIIFFVFVTAPSTWGAGLWMYEIGTPNMGTASAGRGAIANDASIAAVNPAGMTKLNRSQLLVSAVGLFVDSKLRWIQLLSEAETVKITKISHRLAASLMSTVRPPV